MWVLSTSKLNLSRRPASAGPTAIPRALALTKAAEALVSCLTGTWSEMYLLLIALAPPNLQVSKKKYTSILEQQIIT